MKRFKYILKKIVPFVAMAIILQNCMLAGRMDKLVTEHYGAQNALKPVDNKNNIILNTAQLPRINGYCKSNYKNFFTVPLLVYFYSDEKINCSVNSRFYINAVINEISRLTENDTIFKQQQLELSFTSVPNLFGHQFKNNLITLTYIFGYFSMSFSKEEMFWPQGNITLTYVLKDKNTLAVIKQGDLTEFIPRGYSRRNGNLRRKFFVQDFVTSFDNSMTNGCKLVAQKLINQLKS